MDNPEAMDTDGGMGAGAADAPDIAVDDGGDATGGGSPGNPDDMGADEEHCIDGERRVDDPAGETTLDGPDFQHPTNWRIS